MTDSILAANAAESDYYAARNTPTPQPSTVWLRMTPTGRADHRETCPDLCYLCEEYRLFGACSSCGADTEANEAGESRCCGSHVPPLNDAQLAAIETFGPFNDAESEQWATVQNVWERNA